MNSEAIHKRQEFLITPGDPVIFRFFGSERIHFSFENGGSKKVVELDAYGNLRVCKPTWAEKRATLATIPTLHKYLHSVRAKNIRGNRCMQEPIEIVYQALRGNHEEEPFVKKYIAPAILCHILFENDKDAVWKMLKDTSGSSEVEAILRNCVGIMVEKEELMKTLCEKDADSILNFGERN
jgi:hypothetical protein